MVSKKKVEMARHDLSAISKMKLGAAAKLARSEGVPADTVKWAVKDRDVGGLAHQIVIRHYGRPVHVAVLKSFRGLTQR